MDCNLLIITYLYRIRVFLRKLLLIFTFFELVFLPIHVGSLYYHKKVMQRHPEVRCTTSIQLFNCKRVRSGDLLFPGHGAGEENIILQMHMFVQVAFKLLQ